MCYAGKPTESVVIVKKKKEKAIAIIQKLCFTFFLAKKLTKKVGKAIRKSLVSPAATLRVVATRWLQLVNHKPQTDMPPPPRAIKFCVPHCFQYLWDPKSSNHKRNAYKNLKTKIKVCHGRFSEGSTQAWFV